MTNHLSSRLSQDMGAHVSSECYESLSRLSRHDALGQQNALPNHWRGWRSMSCLFWMFLTRLVLWKGSGTFGRFWQVLGENNKGSKRKVFRVVREQRDVFVLFKLGMLFPYSSESWLLYRKAAVPENVPVLQRKYKEVVKENDDLRSQIEDMQLQIDALTKWVSSLFEAIHSVGKRPRKRRKRWMSFFLLFRLKNLCLPKKSFSLLNQRKNKAQCSRMKQLKAVSPRMKTWEVLVAALTCLNRKKSFQLRPRNVLDSKKSLNKSKQVPANFLKSLSVRLIILLKVSDALYSWIRPRYSVVASRSWIRQIKEWKCDSRARSRWREKSYKAIDGISSHYIVALLTWRWISRLDTRGNVPACLTRLKTWQSRLKNAKRSVRLFSRYSPSIWNQQVYLCRKATNNSKRAFTIWVPNWKKLRMKRVISRYSSLFMRIPAYNR